MQNPKPRPGSLLQEKVLVKLVGSPCRSDLGTLSTERVDSTEWTESESNCWWKFHLWKLIDLNRSKQIWTIYYISRKITHLNMKQSPLCQVAKIATRVSGGPVWRTFALSCATWLRLSKHAAFAGESLKLKQQNRRKSNQQHSSS